MTTPVEGQEKDVLLVLDKQQGKVSAVKGIDKDGNFILKVGTTNDLERRRKEHNRNYKKSPNYTMPPGGEFVYDFSLPLSKYNTLRYEDKTRQRWQDEGIGEFVRNDRFYCKKKPKTVKVTIRKTYEIPLD